MAYSLEGKRALVTGASAGIGAAIAQEFAVAGATVGICARRSDRLAEVLAACQLRAPGSRSWTFDLVQLDQIDDFARAVEAQLGGVDILVNNAGIPKRRHIRDLSVTEVDAVMALNYLSPVHLTLALLPGMTARGEGHIVNISSIAGRLGAPRESAYAASKAALSAFSESMAVDLAGTGVAVHIVNPGIIDTELFGLPDNEPSLADLEALPPEELARAVRVQLEEGRFELYYPEWFAEVAATKARDVESFLASSAAWVAQRERELGHTPS